MSRRPYLALSTRGASETAGSLIADVVRRVETERGWRRAYAAADLLVWTSPCLSLPVWPLAKGWGVVLGDVLPRQGWRLESALEAATWSTASEAARDLSRRVWGSCLAIFAGPPLADIAVYRDPASALGCAIWSLAPGVELLTSDLVNVPIGLRPRRMALDWGQIAEVLAAPSTATSSPLFDDMTLVGPGDMVTLRPTGPVVTPIWTPATFTRPTGASDPEIQAELVRRVDVATRALLDGHDRVLAELSGGLDSSILAGAVGATGQQDRIVQWLNYRDARPEADESLYARAVTDRLGAHLTVEVKPVIPLDEQGLSELGLFSRPAVGAVDAGRDRFERARLKALGATAILSGQGGDGLFFQYPSPLVVADDFERRGARSLGSGIPAAIARRTRQSVWAVLAQAWAARRGRGRQPVMTSTLLAPELAAFAPQIEHAWLRDARGRGLPAGKLLHVRGTALTHFYHGPSRRLDQADMLTPLYTPEVMELCLSIPTPTLAGASYDRPFARTAFAERLPRAVLSRRAKGDLSAHVGRMVAASAAFLRPYLLDGCLCEAGLLDRTRVAAVLDEDALMMGQVGGAGDVLNAVAVEAWVRYWQTQVPDGKSACRS
jgi:asparagine synthase (glutamine-hydrolysing)